MMTTGSWW